MFAAGFFVSRKPFRSKCDAWKFKKRWTNENNFWSMLELSGFTCIDGWRAHRWNVERGYENKRKQKPNAGNWKCKFIRFLFCLHPEKRNQWIEIAMWLSLVCHFFHFSHHPYEGNLLANLFNKLCLFMRDTQSHSPHLQRLSALYSLHPWSRPKEEAKKSCNWRGQNLLWIHFSTSECFGSHPKNVRNWILTDYARQ